LDKCSCVVASANTAPLKIPADVAFCTKIAENQQDGEDVFNYKPEVNLTR
jgi:hypothetical protein